ncbi:hypothetical protein GCM10009098_15220 [Rheinheimera aquimaris]|uniref:Cellulose-binding protein n=1 Tax=Rheinheimera aquimaris TaxID=412437 RepID=A0ABP3NRH4_9GAMM|nr:hypothetical protein [Rheinheimera aquimaris]MCB5213366.1 hypothetical protein [Rheinheimera aquimaris]
MRFALLLLCPQWVAAAGLVLGTHSPVDGNSSQQQINCIMQQTRQPYTLQVMPWRRARQEVKMDRIDGYFTAMPNDDMNDFAQLSAPLFLENWYWFWHQRHAGPDSKEPIRYGAILGSHQADWLAQHEHKPDVEVNDLAQLVQLLNIGRIDILLADLDDFNEVARRLKIDSTEFHQRFFRYVPLGVYFAHKALQQRPGFIAQFNAATHLCASAPFALSTAEQQLILSKLLADVQQLARLPLLRQRLQQQNQPEVDLSAMLLLDSQWQQQLLASPDDSLAAKMLSSAASEVLQQWQTQYAELVTEVILMDQHGANAAISRVTTDYWQGDEMPFLGIFEQQAAYFIDVVEYDQSTRRFQVKLSVPVRDGQRHIGVLSVGIDVERALATN